MTIKTTQSSEDNDPRRPLAFSPAKQNEARTSPNSNASITAQYLYRSDDLFVFMDLDTFDQFSLTAEFVDDRADLLQDGLEGIHCVLTDGKTTALELPPTVELLVKQCHFVRTKQVATLETGLTIEVPSHIEAGNYVTINTATRELVTDS